MDLLNQLIARRDGEVAKATVLIEAAQTAKRSLTPDEDLAVRAATLSAEALSAHIEELRAQYAADAEARKNLLAPVHVTSEPHTYERGGENSFFRDLRRMRNGDWEARERLVRHQAEVVKDAQTDPKSNFARMFTPAELRALSTTAGAGGEFVPPGYFIDEWIAYARPGRVFANALRQMDLPKGIDVVNLPKVTGGTAVAGQSAQNSAVQETDLTTEYVSAAVATLAGQQTVSLQMIEQSPINIDEVVGPDLLAALANTIDSQAINGAASSQSSILGVLNLPSADTTTIAYTTTTPSAAGLLPLISQAKAAIATKRFRPATAIFMTPTRWEWIASSSDTTGRPLVTPDAMAAFQAWGAASGSNPTMTAPMGTLLGLPVFVDPLIPQNLGTGTDQDVIIVARPIDATLYEGKVTVRMVDQTLAQNLSAIFQVYEYLTALYRYSHAFAVVSGTGLTTPTF
ncbi:MAG: phage major capsid protein [Ferrimicrobium sp.]